MVQGGLDLRRNWRTAIVPVVLVALGLPVLVAREVTAVPPPGMAARYNENINGDFLLVGNSVLKCGSSAGECSAVSTNNDVLNMTNNDPDGAGRLFNGSSATFTIPAGSVVDAAYLYWGADLGASGTLVSGAEAPVCSAMHAEPADLSTAHKALADTVKVSVSSGAYTGVTATTSHTSPSGGLGQSLPSGAGVDGLVYESVADITGMLSSVGGGVAVPVKVADVQTAQGQNCFAGWSLTVIYRFPNLNCLTGNADNAGVGANFRNDYRNVAVYDGLLRQKDGAADTTTTLTGFLTAQPGPNALRLGVLAWEGDQYLTQDRMLVKSNLSGSASPVVPAGIGGASTNFFDSGKQTVADHNANLSADPDAGAFIENGFTGANRGDGHGIDAKTQIVQVPGGTSAVDVTFTTTADNYYPGGFDLSSPLKCLLIIDKDQAVNGSAVGRDNSTSPAPFVVGGDVITYTVPVRVAGDVELTDVTLTDATPAGTTFVPGSIKVGKGRTPADAVAALAPGGSFASGTVSAGLGTMDHLSGAPSSCAAADLCYGAVQFQATVNGDVPAGTVLTNQAGVSFSASGVNGIREQSNVVTDRVGATLTVSKVVTGAIDGDPAAFRFTVVCDGDQVAGSPFSLGNGDTRSVVVPPGGSCAVTEATNPNFAVSVTGDITTNGGSTVMSQDRDVAFANDRRMGRIRVTKTATGIAGDPAPAPAFQFTVTCPGATGYPKVLTVTGSGVAETPSDVPFGASCTVTEASTAGWVQSGSQSVEPVDEVVENVAFTNTRLTGSLIIDKSTVGADGTFDFAVDCDGTAWDVNRTVTTAGGSGRSSVITDIPAGSACTVTEAPKTGWTPTGAPPGPLTIVAGRQTTATFTNTHRSADLVITKVVSGTPAIPVSGSFDFTIDCGPDGVVRKTIDASSATDGSATVPALPVGATCTITEALPAHWALDTTVDGNVNPRTVVISDGGDQQNLATFTNTHTVGSITIDKTIDQGSGTFRFDVTCGKVAVAGSPFVITINADTRGSTVVQNIPEGSSCVVDENPNGSVVDDFVQVTPADNGIVTFAQTTAAQTANFVDHRRTGDLTIAKQFPATSLGDPSKEFTFSWDCGPQSGTGTLTAGGSLRVLDIPTGTACHVSETADADYTATVVPDGGSVVISDDHPNVVTFTNARKTGTVEIRKRLVPASDPGRFDLLLDGKIKASNVGDGATTGPITVLSGTHGVAEAVTDGNAASPGDHGRELVCTDTRDGSVVPVSGDSTVLVGEGATVVCAFTNTRLPLLQIAKVVSPADDSGVFGLTLDGTTKATGGNGATSPYFTTSVGAHVVGEIAGNATTTLSDYTSATECRSDGGEGPVVSSTGSVTLAAGDRVRCVITNTVKPFVDLAIVKTLPEASLTFGDQATYSLEVSNNGPATATGIAVSDALPSGGLALVSATGTGWTCGAEGQKVTCTTASSLARGAKLPLIAVLVKVNAAGNTVTNTATVAGTKVDRDLTDNTSTVTTPVKGRAENKSETRPLATTGTSVLPKFASGVLMMLGGALLLVFARRRRR